MITCVYDLMSKTNSLILLRELNVKALVAKVRQGLVPAVVPSMQTFKRSVRRGHILESHSHFAIRLFNETFVYSSVLFALVNHVVSHFFVLIL